MSLLIAVLFYSVVNNQFLEYQNQAFVGGVESAHAFGHPGRGQLRLDKEEIRGAYAIADALYERAYYGSAGEKNEWDTSLYGPTSPGPGSFKGAEVRFYDSGVTNHPDMVFDYLRPFDLKYIWNLEETATKFTRDRESGAPILSKPSWDSGARKIWWSSTQIEDDGANAFDWSSIPYPNGIYSDSFIALQEFGESVLGGGWHADEGDTGKSLIPIQFASQVSWNDMDNFFGGRTLHSLSNSLASLVDMTVKAKDKPTGVHYEGQMGQRIFGDEYLVQYGEECRTNVSALAGIGRLASVLDRTYELAMPKPSEGNYVTAHYLSISRAYDKMTSNVEVVHGKLKIDFQSGAHVSAHVDFDDVFEENKRKIHNPTIALTQGGTNFVWRNTGRASVERDEFRFEGAHVDTTGSFVVHFHESGSESSISDDITPEMVKQIYFADGERLHTNVYFYLDFGYDEVIGCFNAVRRNIRNDEGPLIEDWSEMGFSWFPDDLQDKEVEVNVTSECETYGSASWYWTDPVSEANISEGYHFAGPGAVADQKVLHSYSTQAGGIYVFDIPYTRYNYWYCPGAGMLVEDVDNEEAVITKYYRTTGWNDFVGMMKWVPTMAQFRANVHAELNEYAESAGAAPDEGGNCIKAKDGCLDPNQKHLIRGQYDVVASLNGFTGRKECWLVIKDPDNPEYDELYYFDEAPVGMTNRWVSAYPLSIELQVNLVFNNNAKFYPSDFPKIRDDPYPFRAPWAADGRAATLIRTDWKWDGYTNR